MGSQYCLLPPPSQKVYNCGDAITAPDVLGQPHWLGAVLQTLVATSQCLRWERAMVDVGSFFASVPRSTRFLWGGI